jgi:hypothetical protein
MTTVSTASLTGRWAAITLITRMVLLAGVLLGGSIGVIGAPPVHADPSSSAENQFLIDVHSHMQAYGDTRADRLKDADVVGEGLMACHDLAIGVNPQQQGIDAVIAQYAQADLCAGGRSLGGSHPQPRG